MTQTAAQPRKTLTTRLGTNQKTLQRKALEKAAAAPKPEGEGLEEIFPTPPAADLGHAAQAETADVTTTDGSVEQSAAITTDVSNNGVPALDTIGSIAAPDASTNQSASPLSIPLEDQAAPTVLGQSDLRPSWSEADESAYQAMVARRKAAGFQRRGRDVSVQRVIVGQIKPNEGTVVATIVSIVADKVTVGRGELIDLMAGATFANPKAKPGDRAWCQGYVQGAIRDGFLMLSDDGGALGERSPEAAS